MRGPSLTRMLQQRYITVVFDNKDKVIMWDTKINSKEAAETAALYKDCLLYTSPSPRDKRQSRMPSSA